MTFVDEASAESGTDPEETLARPDQPVTITPDRPHHIVPGDDAEFHVQFYDPAP